MMKNKKRFFYCLCAFLAGVTFSALAGCSITAKSSIGGLGSELKVGATAACGQRIPEGQYVERRK